MKVYRRLLCARGDVPGATALVSPASSGSQVLVMNVGVAAGVFNVQPVKFLPRGRFPFLSVYRNGFDCQYRHLCVGCYWLGRSICFYTVIFKLGGARPG